MSLGSRAPLLNPPWQNRKNVIPHFSTPFLSPGWKKKMQFQLKLSWCELTGANRKTHLITAAVSAFFPHVHHPLFSSLSFFLNNFLLFLIIQSQVLFFFYMITFCARSLSLCCVTDNCIMCVYTRVCVWCVSVYVVCVLIWDFGLM